MKQLQTISRQPSQTGPPVLCRLSTRVADDFVIVLGPRPFARTICLTDFVIYATQPKTTTGKTFAWMSWLIKLPSNWKAANKDRTIDVRLVGKSLRGIHLGEQRPFVSIFSPCGCHWYFQTESSQSQFQFRTEKPLDNLPTFFTWHLNKTSLFASFIDFSLSFLRLTNFWLRA